jgi:hypothetical protein
LRLSGQGHARGFLRGETPHLAHAVVVGRVEIENDQAAPMTENVVRGRHGQEPTVVGYGLELGLGVGTELAHVVVPVR